MIGLKLECNFKLCTDSKIFSSPLMSVPFPRLTDFQHFRDFNEKGMQLCAVPYGKI